MEGPVLNNRGGFLSVGLIFLYAFVFDPSHVSVNGRPGVFADSWICLLPIGLGLLFLRHSSRWIDVPGRRLIETTGYLPWVPGAPRNEMSLADVIMIDLPTDSHSSEYGDFSIPVLAITQDAPLQLRRFSDINQASTFAVFVAKSLDVPVGTQVKLRPI